jgi:hypothetical protein
MPFSSTARFSQAVSQLPQSFVPLVDALAYGAIEVNVLAVLVAPPKRASEQTNSLTKAMVVMSQIDRSGGLEVVIEVLTEYVDVFHKLVFQLAVPNLPLPARRSYLADVVIYRLDIVLDLHDELISIQPPQWRPGLEIFAIKLGVPQRFQKRHSWPKHLLANQVNVRFASGGPGDAQRHSNENGDFIGVSVDGGIWPLVFAQVEQVSQYLNVLR